MKTSISLFLALLPENILLFGLILFPILEILRFRAKNLAAITFLFFSLTALSTPCS
jgi:hypothetical protein